MFQAIHTKYARPTDTKPARVIARADAGRLVVPWDHALNADDNHRAAALALAARYGWGDRWQGGGLPDRTVAWVRIESDVTHKLGERSRTQGPSMNNENVTFGELCKTPAPEIVGQIYVERQEHETIARAHVDPDQPWIPIKLHKVSDIPGNISLRPRDWAVRSSTGYAVYINGAWRRVWGRQNDIRGSAYVDLTAKEALEFKTSVAFIHIG